MKTGNNNSKFSKVICLVVTAVFMFTTIAIPVYGLEDMSSSETIPQPVSAEAVDTADVQVYEESASSWRFQNGYNIAEPQESGISPNMTTARAAYKAWSKTENGFINSKGQVIEGAVRKGVDVSAWQENVDWAKVKAAGIDFAIIRCGYGDDMKSQDDTEWLYNVQQCEKYDIPYGVYLYSYGSADINYTAKAKKEAAHALRCLKEANANPDYPVYYDLEDDSLADNYTDNEIKKGAAVFCGAVEAAGYEAGIYANYYWWNNVLYDIPKDSAFDQYDKWVAQYNYRCDYKADEYRLWQSTSSGKVNGIPGDVDLNFEFELVNETNRTTDIWSTDAEGNTVYINSEGEIAKSQWIEYRGNTYYVGSTGKRLTGRWYIGDDRYYFNKFGKLVKNSWITVSGYKYYATADGSFAKGYKKIGNYYYLFNSDTGVMRKGTVTVGSKQYKLFSSGKACLSTGKIKTAVNYRTGPSTSYKKKGTYKKGKVVSVIRTSNGWSKLSTGYWVSSKYITKTATYPKTVTTFKKYKVKTTDGINYRTGPGASYKKKGVYSKGTIRTIVAEKNGWGKTSTGYWIKLSYTKKI